MLTVRRMRKRITATNDDEECNLRSKFKRKQFVFCNGCNFTFNMTCMRFIGSSSGDDGGGGSGNNNLFYTSTQNLHRSMLCTLSFSFGRLFLSSFSYISFLSKVKRDGKKCFSLRSEEFTVLYPQRKAKRRESIFIYN